MIWPFFVEWFGVDIRVPVWPTIIFCDFFESYWRLSICFSFAGKWRVEEREGWEGTQPFPVQLPLWLKFPLPRKLQWMAMAKEPRLPQWVNIHGKAWLNWVGGNEMHELPPFNLPTKRARPDQDYFGLKTCFSNIFAAMVPTICFSRDRLDCWHCTIVWI